MTLARNEILETLGEIVSQIAGVPAAQVDQPAHSPGLASARCSSPTWSKKRKSSGTWASPTKDIDFTTVGQLADYILQWEG